jgi:hypothetical protein
VPDGASGSAQPELAPTALYQKFGERREVYSREAAAM